MSKFYRVILCGQKNGLLTDPEVKHKVTFHQPDPNATGENLLCNPFVEISPFELKKAVDLNQTFVIVYDDLQETISNSPLVSRIFSQGRHRN